MQIRLVCLLMLLAGCHHHSTGPGVYTLYRNTGGNPEARVHVATFDSVEEEKFNQLNCQLSATALENEPMVVAKFWCEPGRYKQTP